ncbi:ATP-dependent zinc protease [Stutzerimonas zhaodongensis]|uniref:ATP-dependent zinc protease n=1 Tax=Stutzerimonas zhaodongensis TaxID=1176257 RepID=A0A3M2HVW7_9GAMM|nr:ATP-dependent zinc protease [Stutzerimonas zhaodongensis]MCQ2028208.1 ATP-dependent zinc protease [Stutzerimonas zhaodongensis]MCQ4315570.1 ATP-dependent zinc protease [Stutzerimonas zhaodongensis]RMH91559.1 ATP-dependent zinc protease [Stutzerimonas zhaodongensis]
MSRLLLLLSALTLPAVAAEPTLFGRYEQIKIEDLGKTLKAKMDTGAMTASLSARDIERFEREGEDWVRFRLAVEGADDTLYEHRLARIAEIKTRSEESSAVDPDDDNDAEQGPDYAERPVVQMQLCIGDQLREAEVNLTDRTHFRYPLLIGATAIRDLEAAIDPAQKYTAGRPTC